MTASPASKREASGKGVILGSRLRQQVVGTTAAITLIAMAALTLLVHEVLASTVEGDVSGLLQSRADAVAATLTLRDGQVVAQETPTETLDRTTWVYDLEGRLVEGPATQPALGSAVEELSTSRQERTTAVGDAFRLLAVPVRLPAESGEVAAVVVVAVDLTPYERTEHYALLVTLALGLIVVVGGAGVSAWSLHQARSTLSPGPVEPEPTIAVDGAWWHPVAVTNDHLKIADQPLPLAAVLDVIRDVLAVQAAGSAEGREVFRCT